MYVHTHTHTQRHRHTHTHTFPYLVIRFTYIGTTEILYSKSSIAINLNKLFSDNC